MLMAITVQHRPVVVRNNKAYAITSTPNFYPYSLPCPNNAVRSTSRMRLDCEGKGSTTTTVSIINLAVITKWYLSTSDPGPEQGDERETDQKLSTAGSLPM